MNRYTRIASLGLLFGLVLFLVLAIQVQAGPEPPYTLVKPPLLGTDPELVVHAMSAPVTASNLSRDSAAAPCESGNCPATAVSCEDVVHWKNDRPSQWETYSCLDTNIFPKTPYSETFYSITIGDPLQDLSLAIPLSITDPVTHEPMDNFGAILGLCDNTACQNGHATHVVDEVIKQHAIIPNAPLKTYTMTIDSPNMDGEGDAIIACGSYETGWCKNAISTTFQCGNFAFHDNAGNGLDNITHYGLNYAFDGREMTYEFILTENSYISTTLHYSGNPAQDYNNYMILLILREACNQRDPVGYTGLAGETEDISSSVSGWLPAGTYYLVADGMHMPYGGDPFKVDMGCTSLDATKEAVDLNGGPLYPGDVIEYSVILRNKGGLALDGIRVTDYVPADTTYVANSVTATPQATLSGPDPLIATWANIEAGQTATLTFRVTVNSTAVGKTIANTARVSDSSIESNPGLVEMHRTIGPVFRAPGDVFVYLPIVLKDHK